MLRKKQIIFDVFSLDPENEILWNGPKKIHLRPKAFALLQYLATRPDQLVTKDQLMNALWRECNVGEEALKHCVSEIRRVLGDDAASPRFVETVHRRGYRFVAKSGFPHGGKKSALQSVQRGVREPSDDAISIAGRTLELSNLYHFLARAMQGERQVVFVKGEQGIGKTRLIDAFLEIVTRERPSKRSPRQPVRPWIARGQCFKSHSTVEAYMPFLEALTGLCGNSNRRIVPVLNRHAPLWLIQMPSLVSRARLQNLRRNTSGAMHESMMREMAEALEVLTADKPLILVLEDLHWSDCSSLDLISYWAQRRAPARLLLIGTYRPAEALAENHPLEAMKQELQARQQCHEIFLSFLDETAVQEILAQRFPGHRFPPQTAGWIRQRTGGNPLFMNNVLDYLVAQGFIARRNKRWSLNTTLEKAGSSVPPTIQHIIEQQIDRCTPQERRLLMASSVEGVEFSLLGAAAALGESVENMEALCGNLARRNQFLQPAATRQAADGRQIRCYRFIHELYQSIIYRMLSEDQKAQGHLCVAEQIEKAYGTQSGDLSARMAMHFDLGKDYDRAVKYYCRAAERANSRYAGWEALDLATRGVQLLDRIPDGSGRMESEMCLRKDLGTAWMFARGLGAEEVNSAFSRAHELYKRLNKFRRSDNRKLLFSALFGLWNYHWVHAEYAAAHKLAEQLLQLAESARDPSLLNQAHHAFGIILMDHGEFAQAFNHLNQTAGVVSRCCAALTLWNLGFPDRALESIEEILRSALETKNIENCIFAHLGAARVYMARRESEKALLGAQAALDLAVRQGLVEQWLAPMKSIRAWAFCKTGQLRKGLEQSRQALAVLHSIGSSNWVPLLAGIVAEISMDAGQIHKGLSVVEEALDASSNSGMLHYDSELYRLKGELLMRQTAGAIPARLRNDYFKEAESCFKQALEVARRQRAKSMELRASTSLARFLRIQNRAVEAHTLLLNIYNWFTEGQKTLDIEEARAFLDDIS
jgi:predicted ATPase/DNA-binding winged helix-turn-helix (wHTH) protein